MLRKNPPPKADDELTQRLRTALRQKRAWSIKGLALTLIILASLGALLIWWFYPQPEPPPIVLAALDGLAMPNQPVVLRARLQATAPDERKVDLSGYELSFETGILADITALGKATTGADGEASLTWQPPNAEAFRLFTVRYPGDKYRRPSASQARLFAVEPNSPCLLVDVAALSVADVDTWRKRSVFEIARAAGAGPGLNAAAAKGYRILYAAAAADTVALYIKMRGWIDRETAIAAPAPGFDPKAGKPPPDAAPLPSGPVLARPAADFGKDTAAAWQGLVKDLQRQWKGRVSCVVANAQAASALEGSGATTIVIGPQHVGPPALHVESWIDFEKKLPAVQ